MTWYHSISTSEYVFIVAFVVLYVLYILRVIRVGRRLNTSYEAVFYKISLRTIYFTLLILALLGPSFGATSKEIKAVGKDIFIAVDLSQSMNAFDVQPTRLQKVKFELKKIVGALNTDKIGLIIFSSSAFVQCPLTYDQSALNLFIETLDTSLVPNTGTDFEPPLELAMSKLTDEQAPVLQPKSKIIILISDGEDFGDKGTEVTTKLDKYGISVFTLGVGTKQGSRIYAGNGYKLDDRGEEVISQLDPVSLKTLAANTGGQYFEINETNNEVSKLINTIAKIKGEGKDTRTIDVSANKYYYFLGLALLLITIDILSSIKTIRI